MGKRRQAREFALQALYLSETGKMSITEALAIVTMTSSLDETAWKFVEELALGTESNKTSLDLHIQQIAKNWELARMASVDRNLLRLASYELRYCKETPINVIIDEALEIAKVYSSQDSSKFINGILDKLKSIRVVPAA